MFKDCRIVFGLEVTVFTARLGVGQDHTINELLETPLTLLRADSATEVLCRDDG